MMITNNRNKAPNGCCNALRLSLLMPKYNPPTTIKFTVMIGATGTHLGQPMSLHLPIMFITTITIPRNFTEGMAMAKNSAIGTMHQK